MAAELKGTVLSGANNIFFVRTTAGVRQCRIKGKVLDVPDREYNPLAPGDEVVLEAGMDQEALIAARVPRRTVVTRFNRKRNAVQALAANVDVLACVASVGRPEFRAGLLDRMLVIAAWSGVAARIVITKSDLPIAEPTAAELEVYRGLGFPVFQVSALANAGKEQLSSAFAGLRVMLLGHSGVGKSSLIRWLVPTWDAATAEVVAVTGKGRHTTTVGTLYHGDGAAFELVDTPGVRELDIRTVPAAELGSCFPEIARLSPLCRFQPCTHTHEPGCAVQAGALSGTIHLRRLQSYRRLYAETEELQRIW